MVCLVMVSFLVKIFVCLAKNLGSFTRRLAKTRPLLSHILRAERYGIMLGIIYVGGRQVSRRSPFPGSPKKPGYPFQRMFRHKNRKKKLL